LALQLPAYERDIELRNRAYELEPVIKIELLFGRDVEPQQGLRGGRLKRRTEDDRVARAREGEILGVRTRIQDVDLHIGLLELGVEHADAHQLELRGKRPVDLVLARHVDEGIDIDRHARPHVERQRICAADDIRHVVLAQDPHQLGEHRLHRRAVRFDQDLERVHHRIMGR